MRTICWRARLSSWAPRLNSSSSSCSWLTYSTRTSKTNLPRVHCWEPQRVRFQIVNSAHMDNLASSELTKPHPLSPKLVDWALSTKPNQLFLTRPCLTCSTRCRSCLKPSQRSLPLPQQENLSLCPSKYLVRSHSLRHHWACKFSPWWRGQTHQNLKIRQVPFLPFRTNWLPSLKQPRSRLRNLRRARSRRVERRKTCESHQAACRRFLRRQCSLLSKEKQLSRSRKHKLWQVEDLFKSCLIITIKLIKLARAAEAPLISFPWWASSLAALPHLTAPGSRVKRRLSRSLSRKSKQRHHHRRCLPSTESRYQLPPSQLTISTRSSSVGKEQQPAVPTNPFSNLSCWLSEWMRRSESSLGWIRPLFTV